MDPDSLHQQLDPSPYRTLQPQGAPPFHTNAPPHHLANQVDLSALQEHNDNVYLQQQLQGANDNHVGHGHGHGYPSPHHFGARDHVHRPIQVQNGGPPHTPQQQQQQQYGMMGATPLQHSAIGRLQQDDDIFGPGPSPGDAVANNDTHGAGHEGKGGGQLHTKIVIDPPNLEEWRQKLFDVSDMITLSEEQFETYFPHVDNVYSHRSTQKYKKKQFVSHYWDCRLKGRPPGTPKSDDPNKKKRKRTARERDLCDVKIKITEYYAGAMLQPDFQPDGHMQSDPSVAPNGFYAPGHPGEQPMYPNNQHVLPMSTATVPPNHPGANGAKFYTIQRVNGNGGNGKGDGVPGPHKHDLAYSDNIKKNSVQREILKREKEEKKTQRSSTTEHRAQKTYHKKATGAALTTVRKHSKEHELKLFGSCFCPWVQRVWIALEAKGMQYQYIEVDPYKKPQSLLEVNPRGLVPALRHGNWSCGESTVLMEYLEELNPGRPLLPRDSPESRATARYWADHINRHVIPAFYATLQAQDIQKQIDSATELHTHLQPLISASHPDGPFFAGATMSWVDIFFAPWMVRLSKVLKVYRNWPDPEPGTRWAAWMKAVLGEESVKMTTSTDELYVESYERYAANRPHTSLLANAVNAGMGLP